MSSSSCYSNNNNPRGLHTNQVFYPPFWEVPQNIGDMGLSHTNVPLNHPHIKALQQCAFFMLLYLVNMTPYLALTTPK